MTVIWWMRASTRCRPIDDLRLPTTPALQLATIALRAEGYRTCGSGHHHTTLVALPTIIGAQAIPTVDYLDACRSRRNMVGYDGIGIATIADVEELIEAVEAPRGRITDWLGESHPELA